MITYFAWQKVITVNTMPQEVNFKKIIGADKTVILWDSNFKPIKKYSHVDAV